MRITHLKKYTSKAHGLRGGYVMMTTTLLFVITSLTIIFGIVTPAIAQVKNATRSFTSRESYFLAEAGIENAVYQYKNGHETIQTSLPLNGNTVTVAVTDTGDGKEIVATGEKNNTQRKVEAHLVGDTGAIFNNAVFSGNGGFSITGGSQVIGSVYSNGDIIGSGGASISGAATSATLVSPSTNQSNGTAFPPPYGISFGSNTGPQDVAQSFQVSIATPVTAIRLYMKKSTTAWMNDITLRLMTNNSGTGNPGSTSVASVTIPASSVPTSYGYVAVSLPTAPTLSANTTYWIVLDTGSTWGASYTIAASSGTYANGLAKTGTYNNSWSNTSPSGLDAYFDIVVGGDPGVISGLSIGGDAWAYNIANSSISGAAYCQVGSGNNKSCDTSRTDPSPVGFPISDQNIATWKAGVTSAISPVISGGWTYNGNLTINYMGTTTSTLKKVNGNLTLSCSSYPAAFGDLWVTGNVTIGSGCIFNANQVKIDGALNAGSGQGNIGALEVVGNVTISSGNTLTAGPMKVGGTLNVGSTALVLKGTLWNVGNIVIQSGATVRLHSSYGTQPGVIVVDGRVDLGGGGTFQGSGQTGSYPVLVSLSTCPTGAGCSSSNAMSMSGGAGAILLIAQNGTVSMTGGTAAKALIGKQVVLSSGARVTYDSSLSELDFESGPADGYAIELWQEVE